MTYRALGRICTAGLVRCTRPRTLHLTVLEQLHSVNESIIPCDLSSRLGRPRTYIYSAALTACIDLRGQVDQPESIQHCFSVSSSGYCEHKEGRLPAEGEASTVMEEKPAVAPEVDPASTNQNRELFKRFEVQKLLGKGSYGIVYRVKRLSDGGVYALKEADVRKMSPLERADAVNEIRLLASVKHPNVVRYHEAFLDGNLLCIVMEYAPNGDLGRFIKKGNELKKAFPEEIIWKYFMQICEGLQALHNAQIIHRDIKPMNIFVGDHDVVKVGDLGIAKMIKEGVANTQIGTPHYMPPELWQNKKYTFTSDLWALGCLLYELMTYRVPFEARSMAELRTKVMAGRYKPITPGKYSADLINLMGQLLQVNPQRRPEVSKILASSVVQKHAAGGSHKAPAEPSPKGNILQTIKIPADLRLLQARLPQATYDDGTVKEEQIQARKA